MFMSKELNKLFPSKTVDHLPNYSLNLHIYSFQIHILFLNILGTYSRCYEKDDFQKNVQ